MVNKLSTGPGSNVTNLKILLSAILAYGERYNPANARMTYPALQALYLLGLSAVNAVENIQPVNAKARNARNASFAALDDLTTRTGNSFRAIVTNEAARARVRSLILLIQNGRVNPKKEQPPVEDPNAEPVPAKENASHQSGYDKQLENFNKLIQYLASFPAYVPNETDLTIEGLTDFYDDLTAKNQLVVDTQTQLTNARAVRAEALYKPETGLVPLCNDSKSYIKSVFSTGSPQYKQISKLKFTIYKN